MLDPRLSRFLQAFYLVSIFAAPLTLLNLIGIDWLIFRGLQEAEQAELFPSPLEYLNAETNRMGELYYVPFRESYCWGELVGWTSSAFIRAGGVASVRYYLQGTHRYFFEGQKAAELETARPGKKLEVISLYKRTGANFRLREGTYIGGRRSFRLPLQKDLLEPIEPGSRLRLYVEIDAPFSRSAGYYVDFKLGEACEKGPA